MGDVSPVQESLFVERFAAFLRLDRAAEALPGSDIYPPYLLLCIALVADFGVVNTYKHLTGTTHILLTTPTYGAAVLGLLLTAVGIRYIRDSYARAIDDLRLPERADGDVPDEFTDIVPLRYTAAGYLFAVAVTYGYLLGSVGLDALLTFEGGYVGLANPFVVWVLGYLPFVVEFALLFLGVHFLVPTRIRRAGLGLFYYDPRNMGGFGGIGQLLKRSYYLYTAGLLLYLVIVYGPALLDLGGTPVERGALSVLFFSLAWGVGLLSVGYSMLTMHRHMAAEKRAHMRELEAEIRDLVEAPYEITTPEAADTDQFDDLQRRLTRVTQTREYPATFRMWSQIGFSILIPQLLQLFLGIAV